MGVTNTHIKIDLLISELLLSKIEIKAVVGEEKAATYFNKEWTRLNGKNSKINLHLGVYECRDLISPSNKQNSQFITAKIEHSDIIRKYLNGFLLDCFPLNKPSEIEIEKLMNRHIDGQSLFLLLNETREVVSMAANTRSTLNGGTISLVYTPPEQRGRGYASLTVASLSQKILESGKKFVNLYTDLTNPTSNSIYQKIGFVKIGQNIHFDFVEKI